MDGEAIFETHLKPSALNGWLDKNRRVRNHLVFHLPLDLGLGLKFDGFKGSRFPGVYDSKDLTQYVEESLDHLFKPPDSLQIFLCNLTASEIPGLWQQWITQQLLSSVCIQQWIDSMFAAADLEWARDILNACWSYSTEYLSVKSHNDQKGGLLGCAWPMALLSTIFLRPIRIPTDARQHLFNNPQILGYKHAEVVLSFSTSAVVTKITKSLLFTVYQNFIGAVLSDLNNWYSESTHHDPGHAHCAIILIIVVV